MFGSLIRDLRERRHNRSRRRTKPSNNFRHRSLLLDPLEDRRLLALTYDLTPLGTLGGTASVALGASVVLVGGTQGNPIFELQIVGASTLAGDATEEASIWAVDSGGTLAGPTSLGTLPGAANSKANDINALGFAVGRSGPSQFGQPPATGDHAFLFNPLTSTLTDLGDLPGGDDFSEATALSLSQAVGSSAATNGLRAFVWEATTGLTDLGDLPGGADFSFALDVSNAGQIVGGSGVAAGQHAFLYDTTNGLQDIGALPVTAMGATDFAEAALVNESGLVAGRSLTDVLDGMGQPTGQTAIVPFVYNSQDMNPVMVPLVPPTIAGTLAAVSRPSGINELGAIVGTANTVGLPGGDQLAAWLFSPLRGTVNLNDTLNATGAGWTLLEARAIDDTGRVVGFGTNPAGDLEAFLLTPNNDPPVLDPVGNQSALEGTPLQVNVTASDPNGDDMNFVLGGIDGNGNFKAGLNVPAGMTITTTDPVNGLGVLNWTPADDSPTPFDVTIAVVDDGAGFLSDFESIQITVSNVAPTADAGGSYTINEGDSINLNAIASDPGGVNDPLTFTWDINGDSIFGDATGQNPTLTWAQLNALGITNGPQTVSNVRVRVADDDGGVTDSAATTITVNNVAPTADAGGPYTINEGDPLVVDASASTDPNPADTLTYSWDLNGDSVYGDAVGVNPTVSLAELSTLGLDDGDGTFSVTVQVTDNDGGVGTSPATVLTINNVGPDAGISGPTSAVPGQPRTYTLTATDPGPVDQAANFTFDIDWDGDTVVDETVVGPSGTQVTHVFMTISTPTVGVTATDKDGGSGSGASIGVNVTMFATQPDEQNPSLTNLAWGGTDGLDVVFVLPGGGGTLTLFTAVYGFNFINQIDIVAGVDGKVIHYGLGGSDIMADDFISLPVEMHGGNGNDVLSGGLGGDLIEGDAGNDFFFGTTANVDSGDTLIGADGRDFFYGNQGADSIDGGNGDDLLIAGTASFGSGQLLTGLTKIRDEWLSNRDYATRVANISGTGSGPKKNGNFFIQPGVTVFNDGAADQLFGGGDMDWFVFTVLQDTVFDAEAGEVLTDVP